MKRKSNDIACGRGDGSHVCALATARVCGQCLLCIATSDSNDIHVRDAVTAKTYGTPLTGLSSPAKHLQVLAVLKSLQPFCKPVIDSTRNAGINNDCVYRVG